MTMGNEDATRQVHHIMAPRDGEIAAINTGAAASLDLRTCGNQTADVSKADKKKTGFVATYIYIQVETQDLYVSLSPAAQVVDETARGVAAVHGGWLVKAGLDPLRVRVEEGIDNFLNHKSPGGAGVLRVYKSAPY